MALLDSFQDEREPADPFLSLDDGYSIESDSDDDFSLSSTQNSMQAAQQLAQIHSGVYQNLGNTQDWSGYNSNPSSGSGQPDQSKMRDITPTQRFHLTTGLIDARAPRSNVHEGLDYPDRGAQGFTPQAQWSAQFSPRPGLTPPKAERPMSQSSLGGAQSPAKYSWENTPHTFQSPF